MTAPTPGELDIEDRELRSLLELQSWVRTATGPDREIDRCLMALSYSQDRRHIGCQCWDDEHDTCCPGSKHLETVWVDPSTDKWVTNASHGHEFSSSIDAAIALVTRLLPDWGYQVGRPIQTYGKVGWYASVFRERRADEHGFMAGHFPNFYEADGSHREKRQYSPSASLAIIDALLSALAAQSSKSELASGPTNTPINRAE